MSNQDVKAELELFRGSVKRYIGSEIAPHYDQWEKDGIIPRDVWTKLGEQGLLCVGIPEAYGGFESGFLFSSVIAEEFSRANMAALATNTTVHSDIVAHYVLNAGTEEQKLKYLPKMVSGEIVGAIAMTEPGCGSDLQGVRATAKLDGDDYVINGSKTFITNGQHCGFVIVVARTKMDVSGAKGTSLFIVDCDSAGFSRGRNLDKIGLHSGDTSEMFFEDVRVPKTALLGPLNGGFGVLMGELQRERLTLAVNAVAAAEGALQFAIDYAKERTAFGGPISKLQNTKFRLAEMATEVRVHKAFIEECKVSYMVNQLDVASASMAKLSCTEMQGRIVDGCLQIFGGYGYMSEYPISRAFVDARVQRIYGGTSEIMKELISRSLVAD